MSSRWALGISIQQPRAAQMLVKLGHKTVDTLRWFVPSETGKHEVIGEVNGSELPGDPLIEQAYWASIQPSIPKKLSTINPTI